MSLKRQDGNMSLRVFLEQSSAENVECCLEQQIFPKPPPQYVCPLSNELMTDPVQVPGCKTVSYERRHCESWLLGKSSSTTSTTTTTTSTSTFSSYPPPRKNNNRNTTTRRKRIPISPFTGNPVTCNELVSNRTLKWKIDSWRKQRECSIRQYMDLDGNDGFSVFSENSALSSMDSFDTNDTSQNKPWKIMTL